MASVSPVDRIDHAPVEANEELPDESGRSAEQYRFVRQVRCAGNGWRGSSIKERNFLASAGKAGRNRVQAPRFRVTRATMSGALKAPSGLRLSAKKSEGTSRDSRSLLQQ